MRICTSANISAWPSLLLTLLKKRLDYICWPCYIIFSNEGFANRTAVQIWLQQDLQIKLKTSQFFAQLSHQFALCLNNKNPFIQRHFKVPFCVVVPVYSLQFLFVIVAIYMRGSRLPPARHTFSKCISGYPFLHYPVTTIILRNITRILQLSYGRS